MELRQLEHFVAVAEERHFTKAAELLQISQSGLSASIRALESELSATLFVRSTRRVELTAAGDALLQESYRTLASAAAAREAVQSVQGLMSGTVAVGSEQCLGVVDVPHELASFHQQHPGVGVRLGFAGSSALLADVAAGRLDLALVAVCGAPPPGITLEALMRRPFVVLCRPDDFPSDVESVSVGQLAGHRLVGFQPDWAARILTDRLLESGGLPSKVDLEVNDVHTLLDLVEAGMGIALVPQTVAAKRPDRLRAIRLTGEHVPSWDVAVAVPAHRGPAAEALLAQLRIAAREAGGSPSES